jgi:hypothetical protein
MCRGGDLHSPGAASASVAGVGNWRDDTGTSIRTRSSHAMSQFPHPTALKARLLLLVTRRNGPLSSSPPGLSGDDRTGQGRADGTPDLDDDAAFTRLRRLARASSRKVVDVAREIIADRRTR